MALSSSVRAATSRRVKGLEFINSDRGRSLIWAAFLTLVVAAPWLLPGYLFGTDWPGPRHFALPIASDSSAPLEFVLAAVARVAGGDAAGKVLVMGSLFAAAALAYRALPEGGFIPRAAAATVYVVNPFVYGRLNYGQMFLLGAYATLPWALVEMRRLLIKPGARSSLGVAAAFFVLGIFSPHFVLIAGLLATALYAAFLVANNRKRAFLWLSGPWFLASSGVAAVASSYWVVPLASGHGYAGTVITNTDSGALTAYAAVPDRSFGLVPNLLGLYGFWAENTGRFASMKAFVPIWPVVLAALLIVCAIGVIATIRQHPSAVAPWLGGLLVAGAVAFLLEMGMSHPLTSGVVTWLDAHIPIYRGMRDAGKWGALLALIYSQLSGLGAAAILLWLKTKIRGPARAEWVGGFAAALLLALPLYYGNGLLFGAHEEIKPSQYPASWYAADRALVADPHPGRTLFLPWHEYMTYSFIQNQNSVVASPAPSFFSVPILASTNPEVPGIFPPSSPDQVVVAALVKEGPGGRWADVLASIGVKYVLVARELDWQSYGYLDRQPDITEVADLGQILIYRNDLMNP